MSTARLDEERREQARWRPRNANLSRTYADILLNSEFLPEAQRDPHQQRVLHAVLTHAARHVAHYAAALADPSGSPRERLARLPVLSKHTVQVDAAALTARAVPAGHQPIGHTRTSGTTGEPTVVRHSAWSMGAFAWLKQRELRWFRVDPTSRMAAIRPATELPAQPDGTSVARGELARASTWPEVGELFETGPFIGIANTHAVTEQIAFLREVDPDWLIVQSAALEHIALAAGGALGDRLRVCQAISQTLTPQMRRTVESGLGVRVVQNYGLNELGLVASRCVEGGRYHVHAEHAWVELLDDAGQPVGPGQRGRLVVSTLSNLVMPLLRYDTGDLAIAVEGPCPCGRTLPAFGEVLGRYRRIAHLPEGTWPRWGAILEALFRLPPEVRAGVRAYQARQHRDGSWVLRIDYEGWGYDALEAAVVAAFAAAAPGPAPPLHLRRTSQMEGADARKRENFLSDFVPPADGFAS